MKIFEIWVGGSIGKDKDDRDFIDARWIKATSLVAVKRFLKNIGLTDTTIEETDLDPNAVDIGAGVDVVIDVNGAIIRRAAEVDPTTWDVDGTVA